MKPSSALRALVVASIASVASAAPATPQGAHAWLGTFEPTTALPPCADCAAARVVQSVGSVRVLPPGEGDPAPDGDVIVASPFVGLALRAKLASGKIALPWFALDTRDGATGVVVLPADAQVRFVVPAVADIAAIKDALVRADALSNGDRASAMHAFKDLEVSALDLDGDHKADIAATWGCTSYGDGACQRRGQFFLVRRGARWQLVE